MFTGLIECTGRVAVLRQTGEGGILEVNAPLPFSEVQIGESIAVNGACLTVTAKKNPDIFTFDVSPETISRTCFRNTRAGNTVNIERALRMGSRLDGHLVTGHIDCVARLGGNRTKSNALVLDFVMPPEHARFLVEKGSVAVDGISLTVNSVSDTGFSVVIIPHTLSKTTIYGLKNGGEVNIETDIIGKYIARLVAPHSATSGLTMEKLMQNGFF